MRERFESDEFKTYMEAYRAAEQARVEELSRNEEFVRVPEFPPESSLSARNALRRRNRRKQRSILAGLLSAIGTAAGAVLIVAAVVLTFTQVSLTSFSAATHSLEFELAIEWAENSELTARLTSESEQHEQSLSDGDNNYTLRFDELTPDTEYHLEITDGSTVCFSGDYRTEAIEPLTPVGETLLPDGISLTFDGTALTGEYTVYLDGAAAGTIRAEQAEIAWTGLNAKTSYRVTVEDEHGDTVFDKTYTTPAYEISVTETAAELYMTSIRVELNVEHADAPLTATLGGNTQTLQNGANVLLATDLTPGTAYTLEVKDGEGNVCFTKTYVTNTYEQKLFPDETVLQESITLQFDAAELTSDSYTIRLDGAEAESLSAAHATVTFANLTPETSYRVTIEDEHGDTVFDKTYTTPAYEISVTETAAELYMTRIRVELTVEHADTPLTATLGGNTQALQNGANVLLATDLTPGTAYTLEVKDGEGNVCFTKTYVTNTYEQKLFPDETVLQESITLQFDAAELTSDSYTIRLDGAEAESLSAAHATVTFANLTPETSYRVTIEDEHGDTVFDKTYTTPAYEISVTETAAELYMTSIRVELNVEHADAPLTATLGGNTQTLQNGANVLLATDLTPGTAYTLEVKDGEGNVCFTKTYVTNTYEQKLFPDETVLQESITLQFDAAELTSDSYTIRLDGAEAESLSAAHATVTFANLTPETSYRVTVEDEHGDTVFDKTYHTPAYEISVTETAAELYMTRIRVELTVEHADTPLTAQFGGNTQTLQNGANMLEMTGLNPGSTYAISVYNGEEQVFFQTYRTKNYVQTLFTVEEYIGTDMIFLQFDEAALPEEGYTVYVAGALSGSLNKNNSFIQLNDLTPNTRYHIEILDSNGDLMLDAYYLTPYAVVNMGEVSCTPVSIRFTAFVESETGLADVVLRSASGEVYSSVISPETGGDISFTGLTPMTEYTLTITDDRGNVCYENVFRTELSYTLLSISGNQITLEFPAWQFDGAEGIELSLNGTPTDIVFAGGEVTLSDLTPQTEYSVSVRVNGVLWWQNSFTTPDIILDSAEPTVGSTDLSVTFRVQNPQSEPLRVVLLMGDIEQDAETFTEAEFTASFTTIPNGRYVVRLVRESDGLTLWQAVLVTNY